MSKTYHPDFSAAYGAAHYACQQLEAMAGRPVTLDDVDRAMTSLRESVCHFQQFRSELVGNPKPRRGEEPANFPDGDFQ
jgi:hypothetical protein